MKIPVMVNGLTGKMATILAKGIDVTDTYTLFKWALTGPNQPESVEINGSHITLIAPEMHEEFLAGVKSSVPNLAILDACKGNGVADRNAALYSKLRMPFVMLSTGAKDEYKLIKKNVEETQTFCVAAPNMDVRIVTWMAGISHMAENYPGAFEGSELSLSETHQPDKVNSDGKAETSGTMKNSLKKFGCLLNMELTVADILSIRDPDVQAKILRVPDNYIGWHAYHFIEISDKHDGVKDSEKLTFKRHGGESYRKGAMLALKFLTEGNPKKYFNTMEDVLKKV